MYENTPFDGGNFGQNNILLLTNITMNSRNNIHMQDKILSIASYMIRSSVFIPP